MKTNLSLILFLVALMACAACWSAGRPAAWATRSDPATAPDPSRDTLIGTFSSQRVSLTLTRLGAGYEGVVRKGEAQFPLTASRASDSSGRPHAQGTFLANGNTFLFFVTLEGNIAVLKTAETEYRLPREGFIPVAIGTRMTDASR